ncbi:helix-turn-helix domain-containing protein [Rhodococcus sp. NPDC003348]
MFLTLTHTWVTVSLVSQTTHQGGIGEEVRALMARRRISQSALASRLGISQSSMSRRLSGESPFTVDELLRLAEIFEVPVTDLLAASRAA